MQSGIAGQGSSNNNRDLWAGASVTSVSYLFHGLILVLREIMRFIFVFVLFLLFLVGH